MRSFVARGLVLSFLSCTLLSPLYARTLSFEERVRAQEAIERVYYSHQVGATRPFETAVPHQLIENKVLTYLRESVALERVWKTPLTAQALQSELERIARNTRFPERLLEIYRALGEDPTLVEECFARPILVERLAKSSFAFDSRFHASSRTLASRLVEQLKAGDSLGSDGARHSLAEIRVRVQGQRQEPSVSPNPTMDHQLLSAEEFARLRASLPRRVGDIGAITEERDEFNLRVVREEDSQRLLVATYSVPKESWDSWWRQAATSFDSMSVETVSASATLRLPSPRENRPSSTISLDAAPASESLLDDVWQNGVLDDMPDGRHDHSVVWTGNRMIVWGGYTSGSASPSGYLNSGALYDPLTDTWNATSSYGAPVARYKHSAVWTGSQMIVWGGLNGIGRPFPNSGGRYDPATDTWTSMSSNGEPIARRQYSAVWTGSLFIVWGGDSSTGGAGIYLNTGARYDPATDQWSPTSSLNAPSVRSSPSAVWTGNRMIVWGGGNPSPLSTGGRYDPLGDTWTPTAAGGAPLARSMHDAVWTGSRMIVWGGLAGPLTNTGGRYDPATDTWQPTSTLNAPAARREETFLWTGTHFIVWGGTSNSGDTGLNNGGRYDPVADTWAPTNTTNAPSPRYLHTAIWSGNQMIVWGGTIYSPPVEFASGGRYDPVSDSWTPTSMGTGPSARSTPKGVWTGNLMIVWGAERGVNTGGRYDPLADNWTPTTLLGAPTGRQAHTAVWTGNQMIVWGGYDSVPAPLMTGGRYDPITDAWTPTTLVDAPSPRGYHRAVWTGTTMIIWGGSTAYGTLNSGARYDPSTDAWSMVSTDGAPSARYYHSAIWTGSSMIIWGGNDGSWVDTGGRYDPSTDSWLPTSTLNAPAPRGAHTAIWTGSQMVVWGGSPYAEPAVGGRYDPISDSWAYTSITNAPSSRYLHTAVWTGSQMIVWGGFGTQPENTGGRYDPSTDSWTPTSTSNAPMSRISHIAVWTGDSMIVWGGNQGLPLLSGGRYFVAEPDNDGDSIPPGVDNCSNAFNPGQEDADLDGWGDACDCAPGDASAYADPGEIANLRWDAPSMLRWDPLQLDCGMGVSYDVIQGTLGGGALNPNGGTCDLTTTSQAFPGDPAPASAQFFLTRGKNSCGSGSYGSDSAGQERQAPTCP